MAFPTTVDIVNQGEIAKTGDDYALFLKEFSGEVIEVARNSTVMEPHVQFKRISGAKSAQFPGIGTLSGGFHTTGMNIFDEANPIIQDVAHGEITVHVDRPLMTTLMIDDLEEVINHYDSRAPYARAIGKFFAETMDKYLMRLAILASQGLQGDAGLAGVTADHPSGSFVTAAAGATDPSALLTGIQAASEAMDVANVPSEGRKVFVKPAQYNLLADPASQLTDRDFGGDGNGRTADGTVHRAWGMEIVKTNLLPQDNSTATGTGAVGTAADVVGMNGRTYVTNARKTVALCYHEGCLGAVEALPMSVTTDWNKDFQAYDITGRRATGMEILRPEYAVVIRTGDPDAA
jgi:hypothetical protein